MKVLVIGGYGFIGSHIADRFFKEGHQIFVIDNLKSGNTRNIGFKHKSYILDTDDRKCEEVFKANKFDLVIYASSCRYISNSIEFALDSSKTDVQGVINILQLSNRYKIAKFIFISSTSIYGNMENDPFKENDLKNPVSLAGLNKLACELYCKKWSELYGMNVLILRVSSTYGPRQEPDDSLIISGFIDKAIARQEIVVNGDGEQTRDFLYIEDATDAIYRSFESDIIGEYNISSYKQTSVNSVIDILNGVTTIKNIIHTTTDKMDLQKSCSDNTKIKKVLDWVPMVDLEDGINKTYEWNKSNYKNRTLIKKDKTKKKNTWSENIRPYIENLVIFIVLAVLSNIFENEFANNMVLYFSMYILFIGISYGIKQSMVCVFLSSVFYINYQLSLGREILSMLYDSQTLFQISLFILIGLVVGYSIDRKEMKIRDKTDELELLQSKYDFLTGIQNETRIVKEQLQSQIVSSENSFAKVFSLTRQLDSLEPEVVYYSTIHVIESVMKSKKVALYIVGRNGNYLRLMAKSNVDDFDIPVSIKISDYPNIDKQIRAKTIYVNKEFNANMPFMTAPVTDKSKVVALISLYDADFENITLYYKNLFTVVVGLVSASISKSHRFDELLFDKKYIENTFIMKHDYFINILKIKSEAKESINVDFVLIEINTEYKGKEELSHVLTRYLRENDYIGMINNKMYALLSNTNAVQSKKIIEKLAINGIEIANNGEIEYV